MVNQQQVRAALHEGGVIDITTTGRKSRQPRRIEIVFFNIGGRVYISGLPGSRGWLANLMADPSFTFHLKKGIQADLPANARIIDHPDERRPVIEHIVRGWRREPQLDSFLERAPLIEVTFEDRALLAA
jgi:deazaflavin-dependent oxidoreductase (nitroreductase family)